MSNIQIMNEANNKFVQRQGSKLILDGKPFRFGGPNIYWLGLDENVNGVDFPTGFRINNVLDTALEMGATVIRSHTLGISAGHSKSIQPELGTFNEEALRKIDYALKAIGDRGLRVVIPLVDNWSYYHGGRETFVKWRGLTDANEFYTNINIIDDFKKYIHTLLHRINTYTGVAYKDDPAILAWEVGNELEDTPKDWVELIVNYIKGLDQNHLVMYGNRFGLDYEKLDIQKLDILDAHYYPIKAEQLLTDANAAKKANKSLVIGEYGWTEGNLTQFLKVAEENLAVSGTLFWSLFGHHDKNGYVNHYDSFSLHYPGHLISMDRAERIQQLRNHGFKMSGRKVPKHSIPEAPELIQATTFIKWRGVVGAAYYTIERSNQGEDGPWAVICEKFVSDHHSSWVDSNRDSMKDAWYRIKAYNIDGVEGDYSQPYFSKAGNGHAIIEESPESVI